MDIQQLQQQFSRLITSDFDAIVAKPTSASTDEPTTYTLALDAASLVVTEEVSDRKHHWHYQFDTDTLSVDRQDVAPEFRLKLDLILKTITTRIKNRQMTLAKVIKER